MGRWCTPPESLSGGSQERLTSCSTHISFSMWPSSSQLWYVCTVIMRRVNVSIYMCQQFHSLTAAAATSLWCAFQQADRLKVQGRNISRQAALLCCSPAKFESRQRSPDLACSNIRVGTTTSSSAGPAGSGDTHHRLTPALCVQVHYRGLRVLVAWRDAQGGCSSPSYPNLSLPPRLEASLLNNTAIL